MKPQSSSSAPSEPSGERVQYPVEHADLISQLPDDLLEMILEALSTEDAVKTSVLSTRWEHLWKQKLHLCLDMRKVRETTPTEDVRRVSVSSAESMTKILNNHRGRLESCTIRHCAAQSRDGTLGSWIETVLTDVKQTKELTLENYTGFLGHFDGYNSLWLPPNAFSCQSLTSLSLTRYRLIGAQAFNNCSNLKTLKLFNIITNVRDLNGVFAACSSLEVLVLHITSLRPYGGLKIENKNLEVLQITCAHMIGTMIINAPLLEILDVRYVHWRHRFIIVAPKIQFHRAYGVGGFVPHLSFNISRLAQEKKSIWLELMVSQFHNMRRAGSLSVNIDVRSTEEVEILKEVLLLWGEGMKELEIVFKDDGARSGTTQQNWWEDEKPFPDAYFFVSTVRMYNFSDSSEEEFAFASRFVTQNTVMERLMIQTSAYPPTKKLTTEAKVAKLMELPKGNDALIIECF